MPRGPVARTAKLASLPLGFAGRAALGLGKRVVGFAEDVVGEEVQRRTAEQLFSVLGQLKGGAMKLGLSLYVLEASIPDLLSAAYRAALNKLKDAAAPLPGA
ncbi:MAG: AarF/ABC1/UbiB kinase family protein, partial [Stackebrandtia sp.]